MPYQLMVLCGGHPVRTIYQTHLLPRAADELDIPFVASGGMADARSLSPPCYGCRGNEYGNTIYCYERGAGS